MKTIKVILLIGVVMLTNLAYCQNCGVNRLKQQQQEREKYYQQQKQVEERQKEFQQDKSQINASLKGSNTDIKTQKPQFKTLNSTQQSTEQQTLPSRPKVSEEKPKRPQIVEVAYNYSDKNAVMNIVDMSANKLTDKTADFLRQKGRYERDSENDILVKKIISQSMELVVNTANNEVTDYYKSDKTKPIGLRVNESLKEKIDGIKENIYDYLGIRSSAANKAIQHSTNTPKLANGILGNAMEHIKGKIDNTEYWKRFSNKGKDYSSETIKTALK